MPNPWRPGLAAGALGALVLACGAGPGVGFEPGAEPPVTPAPGGADAIDGGASGDAGSGLDPAILAQLAERPWEVVSAKGETYLPNVFYADPSENEQIMPYTVGRHVMIDRLVYPTLGNPNLYTKGDATDRFMTVLRIEDDVIAHLAPRIAPIAGSHLSTLTLTEDANAGIAFFLVARSARVTSTETERALTAGAGVYRVVPSSMVVNPEPADMPEALKRRKTLRFVFDQAAMARVPAGLYDVRMEVREAGAARFSEYQYNAACVFETEPDEHSVLNVTDTQVSVGALYGAKTKDHLDDLVRWVATTSDPIVKAASFITFNGDLHNGGSPGTFRQRAVAWTYADEAKAIVDALKELPLPIFLTAGNHDGYVSTGQVPGAVKAIDVADSLQDVVNDAFPKVWPGFVWSDFNGWLGRTAAADFLGGYHRDIVTGGFARSGAGVTYGTAWKELPRAERNYVLYDGFHQWQKTYGPLYASWKFGKSTYVSLNSFELRQHRRSGWGMYTVNYGGALTDAQLSWLDRELLRAKVDKGDVIILAHHDPRGGHQGLDHGYLFEQIEYRSVFQSAFNYVTGEVVNEQLCKLPDWALPDSQGQSCLHDGLQEWMRPDEELDCAWSERGADFRCKQGATPYLSGVELMKRIAASPEVRTVLLGHTHANQLEVMAQGDELLPGRLPLDPARAATLEVTNPVRGYSMQQASSRINVADYGVSGLELAPVARRYAAFAQVYAGAVRGWQRTLGLDTAGPRELVLMRLVSNADLTRQKTADGRNAMGFCVLHLTKKNGPARINKVTFFVNGRSQGFAPFRTIDIDRTVKVRARDATNPVEQLYD